MSVAALKKKTQNTSTLEKCSNKLFTVWSNERLTLFLIKSKENKIHPTYIMYYFEIMCRI